MRLTTTTVLLALALLQWSSSSCLAQGEAPKDGDVRLVGPSDHRGTVSIYHKGVWGSICDDSWGYADADVVCRQLGYVRASRILYRAYYGQAPGTQIWIDQIRCPNDAKSLLDCEPPPERWGEHDCSKSEDAGVDCLRRIPRKPTEMPIRLSCPECVQRGTCTRCPRKRGPAPTDCTVQTAVEGVVFAQYENVWRPVTGQGWDMRDAQVVCGELGYPVALPPPTLQELWSNWNGTFLEGCSSRLIGGPSYPRCDSVLGTGGDEGSGLVDLGLCTDEEIAENDHYRNNLRDTLLLKVQCEGNEGRLLDCYFPEFGPHTTSGPLSVATVRCGFKPHPSCSQESTAEVRSL